MEITGQTTATKEQKAHYTARMSTGASVSTRTRQLMKIPGKSKKARLAGDTEETGEAAPEPEIPKTAEEIEQTGEAAPEPEIPKTAEKSKKTKAAEEIEQTGEAAPAQETPKTSKSSKSSKKTSTTVATVEPPIKSPERIQLPPPVVTLRDRNQGVIVNWDDFGAVFAELYQMNLFELIQSQEYDRDVEAREQIELTITDGILPALLKNASLPKRPANWNTALFDFYQKMQQKIITEIGLEEFLACSVFRIRAVVSSTIYK